MPRPALWTAIADTLRADIAQGRYGVGGQLPTEAELSSRFGVNRHTIRHALAALVQEGLIYTRRGSGAFVAQHPAAYPLGRRVRFHQNIVASGRTPARRLTRLETCPAIASEAAALDLPLGADVHIVEGISLADGQPIALFRSAFPAERLVGFLDQVARDPSITVALAACGVADYTRASTRVTAHLARPIEATALQLGPGAALLRTQAINTDLDGRPIEYGITWFAGERVELTLSSD